MPTYSARAASGQSGHWSALAKSNTSSAVRAASGGTSRGPREPEPPPGGAHGVAGLRGTAGYRGKGYFVRGHGMQNNERRRAKASSGETLHIGVARRRRANP